jgi:biopolymer transport protein ExbD
MIREGGLKRKSKPSSDIPSSSLADMAFLLLIFFMVTTVFPRERPRDVEIPEAEATKKLDTPRRHTLNVFVERDGSIFINDMRVPSDRVAAIVGPLYEETQQQLVVVIRGDRDTPYHYVDAVQKQLQEARAVRVAFYTNLEQRIVRERR